MAHDPRRLGFRARLAVIGLTAVNATSRRLGRGAGTVVGGRVGLAIAPDLLRRLLEHRDVVLVSGTNGKTTTTALIRAAFGGRPVTNATGANMPAGLVAALAGDRTTLAVLEVDESWLSTVMDAASLSHRRTVVLLNLSRDQLDRSSEVRQLAERWRVIFDDQELSAAWTVVANVSDPLVAYAVKNAGHLVACAVPTGWRADAVSCPVCTKPLHYVSDVRCPCHDEPVEVQSWSSECGFSEPVPDAILSTEVHIGTEKYALQLALPGQFNRANATLALVAAQCHEVDLVWALERMSQVREVAGRYALRSWGGSLWRLMLAKNPAGVDALLESLDPTTNDLVVAINANVADGRDPSWLYDAPFEKLRGRRVWCDGDRALDVATRLDYAGVSWEIAGDHTSFPATINSSSPIDVIANYTAFAQWLARSSPC